MVNKPGLEPEPGPRLSIRKRAPATRTSSFLFPPSLNRTPYGIAMEGRLSGKVLLIVVSKGSASEDSSSYRRHITSYGMLQTRYM
jgi:hypothetical protein